LITLKITLTHQKLNHSKSSWRNVRNWGSIAPIAPPGYAPVFKTNVIAIAIVITYNVILIVIDYIVILFIRNRNRAGGK